MNLLLSVEVHDVTPAADAEVREIKERLAAIGVARPTLLVVPEFRDTHGRAWPLADYPEFVERLRADQAAGAEIILHGLTHRAPFGPPAGLRNWMMYHWFSRGCAEFAHLSYENARRRLARGRRILEELGLEPRGFIAPAWQQSAGAREAVERAGFEIGAFFGHVQIGRERVPSPVLTFAAPGAWADHPKRIYMRAVESKARGRAELLRVALHPEDVGGARPIGHAIERIRVLLGERLLVNYQEYVFMRREVRAA